MLGFVVVAMALALRAPLTTTAVALMVFGVLHNVLELRYIGGRFSSVMTGPLLRLLVALVSGIVLVRLLGAAFGLGVAIPAEIVLTYLILGTAAVSGLRHSRWAMTVVLAVLVTGLVASLTWPAYHVVVITHLHNLVPLAFLWDFARAFPTWKRRIFLAVQLVWLLLLPGLILSGLFDAWMTGASSATRLFHTVPSVIASGVLPPGASDSTVGARFLTVFAFMQLLHFLVWVWYLPRYAPDATEAFEQRVPWLTGRRTWGLGLGIGVGLFCLFLVDYGQGRSVYTTLASYHAFLELPVLLAMLVGFSGFRAAARSEGVPALARD